MNQANSSSPSKKSQLVASPPHWFVRGFLVGGLVCGALNAASYFYHSDDWGNLLGLHPDHGEAIGFPFVVWQKGNAYNGYFVDYFRMAGNLLVAAVVAAITGGLVASQHIWLNRLMKTFDRAMEEYERQNFQFSVRGLFFAMCVVAAGAACVRYFLIARPEVLAGIYILGPWVLVLIALLPQGIPWQQRVVILTPLTLLLIVAAVVIGGRLPRPLLIDEVLLGIFVCWTPQSALAAVAITAVTLVVFRNGLPLPKRPQPAEGDPQDL